MVVEAVLSTLSTLAEEDVAGGLHNSMCTYKVTSGLTRISCFF